MLNKIYFLLKKLWIQHTTHKEVIEIEVWALLTLAYMSLCPCPHVCYERTEGKFIVINW